MNISIIFKDRAPELWPFAAPLLAKGVYLQESMLNMDTVIRHIIMGEWQLWLIDDGVDFLAALTTRIVKYETDKFRLEVLLAGGDDAAAWVPEFLEAVEAYAKQHLCDDVAIIGRKGWERMCKPHGYTHLTTTIRKQLRGLDS